MIVYLLRTDGKAVQGLAYASWGVGTGHRADRDQGRHLFSGIGRSVQFSGECVQFRAQCVQFAADVFSFRVNVSSFAADVSSFRPDVSSFQAHVSSFRGHVSTPSPHCRGSWVGGALGGAPRRGRLPTARRRKGAGQSHQTWGQKRPVRNRPVRRRKRGRLGGLGKGGLPGVAR